METKYVRVPFDVELAKKITNGEVEGKIVTRDGTNARIICFDREDERLPIVGLVKVEAVEVGDVKLEGGEMICPFHLDGMDGRRKFSCHGNPNDLMLEVPEYITFKDGDVYKTKDGDVAIYNCNYKPALRNTPYYVGLRSSDEVLFFHEDEDDIFGFGLEKECTHNVLAEEKQKLIDALKASDDPRAKEYLKRFFGIEEEEIIEAEIKEEKSEYKFKPFDKVICRNENFEWGVDMFSHKQDDIYICIGGSYTDCLPYNEHTAHLLGTTQNYG